MAKFLSLADAAKQLGLTPEELSEMRQRQEVYGFRDGASWKFKVEDIERFAQERAGGSTGDSGLGSAIGLGLGGGSGIDLGLAGSGIAAGSGSGLGGSAINLGLSTDFAIPDDPNAITSVGKASGGKPDEEIIVLADVDEQPAASTSGTLVGANAPPVSLDEPDIELSFDDGPATSSPPSDVRLAEPDEQVKLSATEASGILPIGAADSGMLSGSGVLAGSGILGDQEFSFGDSAPKVVPPTGGESSLKLEEDADDVLSGSGPGSDVTHRPSESGILLIDPSDSGLSLENPLDLSTGGSDLLSQTTDFSTGMSGEVKVDDEFLLTPSEEAEDESDSGSQVIMIESEGEDFDEATATLLAKDIPGMDTGTAALLEEEPAYGGMGGGMPGMGMGPRGPMGMPGGQPQYVAAPEVPFGGLTVMGLALCTIAMAVCGVLMYDLAQSNGTFEGPSGLSSQLMDMFMGK